MTAPRDPSDFGPAARDYARHRQGFPAAFFERVPLAGDLLDLGAGTGDLARGYARRGARAVALDRSTEMLAQAADLGRRVAARAEACPFRAASFDAVTAGQCWHWFDGPSVAAECRRVLRPRGTLVIATLDYLPFPGTVPELSEALLLARNPGWPMAGLHRMEGRYDGVLTAAGFEDLRSVSFELDVAYSHADWVGRMRACNGVLALGDLARVAEYGGALARALAGRFPDPVAIRHEAFALVARAPAGP